MENVLTFEQLEKIRPGLKGVVLAGGVFDLLHVGHINHLKDAKAAGKTLIVHVTSDRRVREKKGADKPVQPEQERAAIVAAIRYVDYVFISDVPHYYEQNLVALKPDVLFFNAEAYTEKVRVYLDGIGWTSRVVVSNRAKKHHTSSIMAKIQASKTYAS